MRPSPRLFGLAVFHFCFWLIAVAKAGDARPVDLVIGGPETRAGAVAQSLEDPLGRLPVEVRLSRTAGVDPKNVIDRGEQAADAFARVFIDVTNEKRVTLYFVDAAWERVLVRHVALEHGLDDVEREEIAQIVRSAVEALLGGAKIGISREEARAELLPESVRPTKAPKRVEPAPVRQKKIEPRRAPPVRPLRVEAGGFYEGQIYRDKLWHGPGVAAGAMTPDPLGLGGALSLQYRTPVEVEGDRLGARLQAIAIRALGRATFSEQAFRLTLAAGIGADLTHVEPIGVAGGGAPKSPTWDAIPVARAIGGAGLGFVEWSIWALGGFDADLIETRYTAVRYGQKYTPFEVPRLRPVFAIELLFLLPELK